MFLSGGKTKESAKQTLIYAEALVRPPALRNCLLLADVAAVRRLFENKCFINDFLCVRISVRRTQVGQVCRATKETNAALLKVSAFLRCPRAKLAAFVMCGGCASA